MLLVVEAAGDRRGRRRLTPSGRGGRRRRDGLGLNGRLVGDGVDQRRLLPVMAGHADVVEVEPRDGLWLVASPVPRGAADQPAAAGHRLLVHLVAPVHGDTHTVHTRKFH